MSWGTKSQEASLLALIPALTASVLVLFAGAAYAGISLLSSGTEVLSEAGSEAFASLWYSLEIAAVSTAISLLLGGGLALWLWQQPRTFPVYLYTFPLIIPHIVAAFFVIAFFSQSGLISSFLFHVGITQTLDSFPVLVFDQRGTGIILAYIYKESAFVTLMVLASLRKLDRRLLTTAKILGAGSLRRFTTVILPAISSNLAVSGLIIFLYSFGSFDIPFLLGSTSRPMASIRAYRLFFEGSLSQRPQALLLLLLVWVVSLIILVIFAVLRRGLGDIMRGSSGGHR